MKPFILTACAVLAIGAAGTAYFLSEKQPLAGGYCPISSDLETGITFVRESGALATFTRIAPDIVSKDVTFPLGGDRLRTLVAHGTYRLEMGFVDVNGAAQPGQTATWRYPVDIAEIPVPDVAIKWTTGVFVDHGHRTENEVWSIEWGTPETATFGNCSYDMIPGTFEIRGQTAFKEDVVHYLPELGISVPYSSYRSVDDQPSISVFVDVQLAGG